MKLLVVIFRKGLVKVIEVVLCSRFSFLLVVFLNILLISFLVNILLLFCVNWIVLVFNGFDDVWLLCFMFFMMIFLSNICEFVWYLLLYCLKVNCLG